MKTTNYNRCLGNVDCGNCGHCDHGSGYGQIYEGTDKWCISLVVEETVPVSGTLYCLGEKGWKLISSEIGSLISWMSRKTPYETDIRCYDGYNLERRFYKF